MKYEDIPYIEILEKEYATKNEIMQFLNISESVFQRMKLSVINKENRGKNYGIYSIDELKSKIKERIKILLECEYIKDFPNYIIDKCGNVYLIKGKIIPYLLKHKIDRYGYDTITLMNESGRGYFAIHRLIALTYIPNPFNLPHVNHIDGNKLNNNIDNLEWCTVQYNTQHAYDNNLSKTGIENHNSSPVIAYNNDGAIDAIFETCMDCGEYYDISEATVRDSHKNKTVNGLCGYYFRRITKDKFYKMKESEYYEKYFIPHQHTRKCSNDFRQVE